MTDPQRLIELAERVEKAEGPDHELDALVDVCNPAYEGGGYPLPAYTASLDAALTLLPEGASLDLSGPRRYLNIPTPVPNYWSAKIFTHDGTGPHRGWGATPALALVAACLRAHASKETTDSARQRQRRGRWTASSMRSRAQSTGFALREKPTRAGRQAVTDPQRLIELAERVEKAEGPDHELDAEGGRYFARTFFGHIPDVPQHGCARFTASLDAAMMLVPEGWRLRQMNFSAPCADDRKWHLNLHGGREGGDTFVGRGATPALALTAACLRAHASKETTDGQ